MQRRRLVTLRILCPHFQRPVEATRNELADRLVDCDSKGECAEVATSASGVTVTVYPRSCPVFRVRDGEGG